MTFLSPAELGPIQAEGSTSTNTTQLTTAFAVLLASNILNLIKVVVNGSMIKIRL